jgi:biopolymer transport protein ExbD
MLIRLGGDGLAHVQGQALTGAELGAVLSARLAEAPDLDVIVLPSGAATVQALAALMDVAVTAGAERLRIVRLEPAP